MNHSKIAKSKLVIYISQGFAWARLERFLHTWKRQRQNRSDVLYNTGRRKGNYLCKDGAKNLLDLLPVPPTVSVPRSHSRSSEQLEMQNNVIIFYCRSYSCLDGKESKFRIDCGLWHEQWLLSSRAHNITRSEIVSKGASGYITIMPGWYSSRVYFQLLPLILFCPISWKIGIRNKRAVSSEEKCLSYKAFLA